jgi:antirestriction protein ArdC
MARAVEAYEALTARIVAQLEEGVVPWVRPWSTVGQSDRPSNYATRKSYNGSNVLALWLAQGAFGYPSAQWLTFVQAKEVGANVRKGEHGTPIVFAEPRFAEQEDESGETVTRSAGRILRGYTVFNVAQVDGLPALSTVTPRPSFETLENVESFVDAVGADVRYGGDAAFYSPWGDFVQVPSRGQFASPESFYATVLHEHAHWTGHPKRLARTFGKRFGDRVYAFEELVAELTAAFLTADLAIPGKLQHPEYLANWAQVLRDDKSALWTAAAQATKAATFLAGLATPMQVAA